MKHDYLWDKTGPPDPEIAQLEAKLSTLQTTGERPAWLREFTATLDSRPAARRAVIVPPVAVVPRPRLRLNVPALSAAAVVLCTLTLGAWFALFPLTPEIAVVSTPMQTVVATRPEIAETPPAPLAIARQARAVAPARTRHAALRPVQQSTSHNSQFIIRQTARRTVPPAQPAPAAEFSEAEAQQAKADLLLALHVINQQLNLAQKNLEGRTITLPELTNTANN